MCRGGNNLPRPDLIDFRLCKLFTPSKTIRRNHYEGTTAEPSNKELPVSEKSLTLGLCCTATGA